MNDRPNILFVISDQHNAKCLGHKGHQDVKTPHLDRIATEGVRFDNAISQNPICTPSRVCFLSGQYAHNHGYYGLNGPNPGGLPTLLGHFRRFAGYRTAAIGKIHCPEYWVEDDCDLFHDTGNTSVGGRTNAYHDFLVERNLEHIEDHGALTEFGSRGGQSCDGRPSNVPFDASQEGWIAERANGFMEDCRREGKPFIIQASLPKPHQCYTPSEPFWSMYDESKLTLPPNADYPMDGKAPHMRRAAERWRKGDWTLFEPKTFEAGRLRKLHGYLGSISHVDHAVGRMLAFLDASGLAENTVVIYTADHGDYAAEHGIMEKAPGICADAITRIPFIWRLPGRFKAGHVATEIVEAVDLSTTLCHVAGVEPMETSDGKDLSHLLKGEAGAVHRIGVTEFAWSRSVRKGNYRMVYYPPEMFPEEYPDGFGELYDLESDPWEMENLYFKAELQGVVQEMTRDLLDWFVTTTRPTTVHGVGTNVGPQAITRFKHTINADRKLNPERLKQTRKRNYL